MIQWWFDVFCTCSSLFDSASAQKEERFVTRTWGLWGGEGIQRKEGGWRRQMMFLRWFRMGAKGTVTIADAPHIIKDAPQPVAEPSVKVRLFLQHFGSLL